jgi:FtsH-binding integral membrane protein
MADYDNRVLNARAGTAGAVDAGLRSYMLRVYNYMLVGLVLTGLTAYAVADVPGIRALFFAYNETTGRMGMTILGWIALFAPLAMVFLMSFGMNRMSKSTAQITFWFYAAIMGISLAPIVWIYTGASIATTFFITAGTFGAMSLYGYTTGRDLTGFGSFLFMGLIGVVIASLVNMFLQSAMMTFVVSIIGVLVFTGLTAYDTQQIKNGYWEGADAETAGKNAIFGALRLYLDFVNLFLLILRLFGGQRR